jgi:hypothetical protein
MVSSASPALALFCVSIYLFLTTIVLLTTLHKTGKHFVYALDDPYIEMALSEDIAHGHYGINPGEPSSPSSSALWPLLLVPLVGTRLHAYLPLVLNVFCCSCSAWLIGWSMARWPNPPPPRSARLKLQQAVIAILVILAANLVSIAFVGMEHGLEILLAIACAYAFTEALAGRAVPRWSLVAAAFAPLVRYEALALSVAMVVLLAGLRRWKSAVALLFAATLPLIAFGLFLRSLGLPWLPTSVLVKGGNFAEGGAPSSIRSTLLHWISLVRINFVLTGSRGAMLLLALPLIALAWRAKSRTRRIALSAAALVPTLQLAIGPFGGFHRYEIYATAFASILLLYTAAEYNRLASPLILLALIAISERSVQFTIQTPQAADGIFGQQYQMHRFVTQFFQGRFAVNDIGLVSYQKPSSDYVLDLSGLSSLEVARTQSPDLAWLAGIAARNRIALAMIPPGPVPGTWTILGQLRLLTPPITASGPCVNFYSTSSSQLQYIRNALVQFAPTLPPESKFTFFLPNADTTSCPTPARR